MRKAVFVASYGKSRREFQTISEMFRYAGDQYYKHPWEFLYPLRFSLELVDKDEYVNEYVIGELSSALLNADESAFLVEFDDGDFADSWQCRSVIDLLYCLSSFDISDSFRVEDADGEEIVKWNWE